ncbi:MAG: hypothetical protein ACPIOQ_83085, partial [Promethearchaeia archaeon]
AAHGRASPPWLQQMQMVQTFSAVLWIATIARLQLGFAWSSSTGAAWQDLPFQVSFSVLPSESLSAVPFACTAITCPFESKPWNGRMLSSKEPWKTCKAAAKASQENRK